MFHSNSYKESTSTFEMTDNSFYQIGSKNSMSVCIQIHILARIQKYPFSISAAVLNIPFR